MGSGPVVSRDYGTVWKLELDGLQKGENSIALELSKRKELWPTGLVLTWVIRCMRVSAEEQDCLEGVGYTQ